LVGWLVGWLELGWLVGWLELGWLVGWLELGWLLNGTSTQNGQFVPTAGRETGLVGYKDGQRDTMHFTLRYTITI